MREKEEQNKKPTKPPITLIWDASPWPVKSVTGANTLFYLCFNGPRAEKVHSGLEGRGSYQQNKDLSTKTPRSLFYGISELPLRILYYRRPNRTRASKKKSRPSSLKSLATLVVNFQGPQVFITSWQSVVPWCYSYQSTKFLQGI